MDTKYECLADVPPYIRSGSYAVDVPLTHVEDWLDSHAGSHGIDLNPAYQRPHVWTDTQRSRYVEHLLRGGQSGRILLWNHPSWWTGRDSVCDLPDVLELVDGKQRLRAIRDVLSGVVPVFGKHLHEWPDWKRVFGPMLTVRMGVNQLQTRAEVLRWYLQINDGGTPHSEEEIEKVRRMLEGMRCRTTTG